MAIDPQQINITTFKDLATAFQPNSGWILAVQDPNGAVINRISLEVLGQMITGNIQFPDGVITGLELEFNNGTDPKTVSVAAGQWRINNEIYRIDTPFVSNINSPSGTNRTDAILADELEIFYQPNFNGTLTPGQILVSSFVVPADGGDINQVPTNPVIYAVMNGTNEGDLNITGLFKINGVPIDGGSGNLSLQFNLSGSDVDSNGNIAMESRIDKDGKPMPASIVFPASIRVYADDADYSQAASFTPSSQILYTGLTGDEAAVTVRMTF